MSRPITHARPSKTGARQNPLSYIIPLATTPSNSQWNLCKTFMVNHSTKEFILVSAVELDPALDIPPNCKCYSNQSEARSLNQLIEVGLQACKESHCIILDIASSSAWNILNEQLSKKINPSTVYVGQVVSAKKQPLISALRAALRPKVFAHFIAGNKNSLSKAFNTTYHIHFDTLLAYVVKELSYTTQKVVPLKSTIHSGHPRTTGSNISWLFFLNFSINKYFITPIRTIHRIGLKQSWRDDSNRIFRLCSASIIVMLFIAMPILSTHYNVSWDENEHNKYGKEMLRYFETRGQDTTAFKNVFFVYYGEFINLASAAINKYISPFGEMETRHLLITMYSLLAIIMSFKLARLLGNDRAALIGLLSFIACPVFIGHAFNNPTDIPMLAGYIMGVYYMCRYLNELPNPSWRTVVLFSIGFYIAFSARVIALFLPAYLGLFNLIYIVQQRKYFFKQIIFYSKYLIVAVGLGWMLAILFWPAAHAHPFTHPLHSLFELVNIEKLAIHRELFMGRLEPTTYFSRWYLPLLMCLTMPVFAIVGVLLFGFFFLAQKKKYLIRTALATSLLCPIAVAVFRKPELYNSWRHFLFLIPPTLVCSTLGWEWVLTFFRQNKIAYVILAVLFCLWLKPMVWIVKYHPNETVYFNELIGGTAGAYGNYELDYYSNSVRAAVEWILKNKHTDKKIMICVNNELLTASYFGNKIDSNVQYNWVREYEEEKQNWDYLILTTRTFSKNELINGSFPPKGTVHQILVEGKPIAVIIKRENNFMPKGYSFFNQNNLDSARYYFSQAVDYEPKNEEPYRMLGLTYLRMQSYAIANAYFDKAIAIYPENFFGLYGKALSYSEQNKMDSAIEYATKTYLTKENLVDAYTLAMYNLIKQNKYETALTVFNLAVKKQTASDMLYYYGGLCLANLHRYSESEQALTQALAINGYNINAMTLIASVYKELGNTSAYNYWVDRIRNAQASK